MAVKEGQDERGRFVKGNKFGSKSKRRDGVAKLVRQMTGDLKDLIEAAIKDHNDPNTPANVRQNIRNWLLAIDVGMNTQFVDKTVRSEDNLEEATKKVDDRENGDN